MKNIRLIILTALVLGFVASGSLLAQEAAPETKPAKAEDTIKVISTGGEPKYSLDSGFPVGKYKMNINIDMNMKQGMGDAEEDEDAAEAPQMPAMEMKMEMSIIITAGDFDDKGLKKIVMQYDSFKMDNPMMGEIYVTAEDVAKKEAQTQPATDEAEDPNPVSVMKDMYGKLMGKKFEITQNRQGEVVDVLMPEIEDDGSGNPMMGMTIDSLKQQLGGQLKEYGKMGKDNLPNVPVGVGASWVNVQKMPIPMIGGDFAVDAKSTLEAINKTDAGNVAVIKTKTKMDLEDIQADGDVANSPIKKFSADMDGTSEYNIDKKIMTNADVKGKMEMCISAGPQGEMTMNIDMGIKMAVTEMK